MKIILAGGSGLIGRLLAEELCKSGHEVVILSRNPEQHRDSFPGISFVKWNGRSVGDWRECVDGAGAIVNLTGENLSSGRWTSKRKQSIIESRVDSGKALVEALQNVKKKPEVFIQASGVGYYGVENNTLLDENATSGDDFLSNTSRLWEASTVPVETLGIRRVIIRSGVVFSRSGGALTRMLLPFRFFVGGPLGSGNQWLSWIHILDEVRAIQFLIVNQQAKGVFNLSATPVTNSDFSRIASSLMHRPGFFRVPAFVIRILFGEMSTLVLEGQRVSSRKLVGLGFKFEFPFVSDALKNLLSVEDY